MIRSFLLYERMNSCCLGEKDILWYYGVDKICFALFFILE